MKESIAGIFHKQIREVRDFRIDMGPKLTSIQESARIESPVSLVPPSNGEITADVSYDPANRRITFRVGGGLLHKTYHLEALFHTSAGQTLEVDILVVIIA